VDLPNAADIRSILFLIGIVLKVCAEPPLAGVHQKKIDLAIHINNMSRHGNQFNRVYQRTGVSQWLYKAWIHIPKMYS
jgi:hypothetical protein